MAGEKLLYAEFICLGAGVLISWNAILTAMDWFGTEFGEFNPSFILPICNFVPAPFMQPLTVVKGHLFSFSKRIVLGFAITGVIIAIIPVLAGAVPGAAGFVLLCLFITLMGTVNAVTQTSVFGMAGMMPGEYTRAVMIGNGLAGIILNVARIICLASFPPDASGLLIGTTVYFLIAGGTLIGCCFAQLHAMKHPLVKQHVHDKYSNLTEATPGEELLNGPEMKKESSGGVNVSYKDLFKKIWVFLGLVFLTYLITFIVFPGVSIATEVSGLSYSWFVVLLITTFNVFDVLGRQAVSVYMLSHRVLIFATFGRLLFVMTTVMIAAQLPPPAIFSGAWFIFLNMALLAFTNGYYSTHHMIYGPSQVEGYLRDKAGSMMATALVAGIFVGSVLSLMFSGIGRHPS
jgi:equilibrative nucleoside transporter 1/2/3